MNELEKYVEEVGLYYETVGLSKMAGRILGYLIASEEKSTSFETLVDVLKASKGSISGNINLLLQRKLIKKIMKLGDRKSYYQLSEANLFSILESKLLSFAQIKDIMQRGNNLNNGVAQRKHDQISKIIRFYDFMGKELPLLHKKWEKQEDKNE